MKTLKFVVEKHRDGFVAYPLGLKGAVVGEGDSYDQHWQMQDPRLHFISRASGKKRSKTRTR